MKKSISLIIYSIIAVIFCMTLQLKSQDIKNPVSRSISLPFYEDWSSGSFEANNWTTGCENWVINDTEGENKPLAEFNWMPHFEGYYSCSLTSDTIDAESIDFGTIILNFEIGLDNRNQTGDERMIVEVHDGNQWINIREMRNQGFIYSHHTALITNYVRGRKFRIRFRATGVNSYDINSWFIDNIELFRICESPRQLDATFYIDEEYGIINEVAWDVPEDTPWHGPIFWGNGENYNGTGLVDGGDISVAIRWDENMLINYNGARIKKIKMFIADGGFSHIVAKIWTGNNASNLIYHDTIENPEIDAWNEVVLDTLLYVDSSLEYWVGYRILDQEPGSLPLGKDKGPGVVHYGDMWSIDELLWDDMGFQSENWNIMLDLYHLDSIDVFLNGYNLYRYVDGIDDDYQLYDFIQHTIGNTNYVYLDTVENYRVPDHCYKINALWTSETDTCISEFGRSVIPIWDYTCIIYEGIKGGDEIKFNLYPNPVSNKFSISSEIQMEGCSILNIHGQLIYDVKLNHSREHQINVFHLNPGLYFLKVKTAAGVLTRKFIKAE